MEENKHTYFWGKNNKSVVWTATVIYKHVLFDRFYSRKYNSALICSTQSWDGVLT